MICVCYLEIHYLCASWALGECCFSYTEVSLQDRQKNPTKRFLIIRLHMRFVCSRIDESVELSNQFNQMINPETGRFFRTIALNGDATEEERQRK